MPNNPIPLTVEAMTEAISDLFDSSSRHVGEHRECVSRILTLIEQSGHKIVPVMHTQDELFEVSENCGPVGCCCPTPSELRDIWDAFLAASPSIEEREGE
jgi:hypothetical protein